MHWFKGSVSQAIAESKTNRSVFVAYITGDDDESKKMDSILDKEEVDIACSNDCTAMKLHVDSVEGKQFASIFPVVYVPCTYFIDGEGIPLEVIGGPLTTEQFIEKANETIQKQRVKFPKLETESSSQDSPSTSKPVSSQNETQADETTSTNSDFAEKVERAKQLIERERKEKEEREKEGARNREKKRREEGKMMTKANTERENTLVQQMAERVRLEKAKDKAARESIRQKIAQDKAERAARQEIEKKERLDAAMRIDPQSRTRASTAEYNETRIQFRLRDGSSATQSFPSDSTLETARQFICTKMNLTRKVTFWTTFPRRHFDDDEFYTKTFSELGLTPSAALIVDSTTGDSLKGSNDATSVSSIISLLLAPFLALMSFIRLFLFGSPQKHGPVMESVPQTSTQSSTSLSNSEVRRRTQKQTSENNSTFNKQGKIHSFQQEEDDDDDENKTWNGNSTQQM